MTLSVYLSHSGVKGMKWGVRRAVDPKTGRVKWPSSKKVTPAKAAGTRKEYKSITSQELQQRINRLNLEKQYSQLLNERELQTNWKKRALHILAKNAGLTLDSAITRPVQGEINSLARTAIKTQTRPLYTVLR